MYCGTREPIQFRRDENFIMQNSGPQKIHVDADDYELQLPLRPQLLLIHAHGPQPIGARTLQESQIICVVDDAAGVGIFPVNVE
jgi:hypothetical protein